ncbi:hypothetical protein [Candidatus Pantoea multigeneris]|uniref:Uncharacterized protein n=1 Tax=Candidatus Pantoea multigeneris TaxID=2608357 RepID=A0ABX0REZ6_9GAMM|nr:hypothetical protein [Pantoea multigeneris]NIF23932.1 hypothetical protein [Pantoea multigeneris]
MINPETSRITEVMSGDPDAPVLCGAQDASSFTQPPQHADSRCSYAARQPSTGPETSDAWPEGLSLLQDSGHLYRLANMEGDLMVIRARTRLACEVGPDEADAIFRVATRFVFFGYQQPERFNVAVRSMLSAIDRVAADISPDFNRWVTHVRQTRQCIKKEAGNEL